MGPSADTQVIPAYSKQLQQQVSKENTASTVPQLAATASVTLSQPQHAPGQAEDIVRLIWSVAAYEVVLRQPLDVQVPC